MNESVLNVIEITLAVLLIVIVLLQQKGAGIGGIFGGSSNIYSTKRGIDKILHTATIALSAVFFLFALARLTF